MNSSAMIKQKHADLLLFENRNKEAEILLKQLLAEANAPSYKDSFVSTIVEGKLKRLYVGHNRTYNR